MKTMIRRILYYSISILCLLLSGCSFPSSGIIGGADGPTAIYTAKASVFEKLYQYKDTYIGDNSNIAAILELLPLSEYRRSFSLQTDRKPYSATIHYDTNIDNISLLYKNACVIFSLVSNADEIIFTYKDERMALSRAQVADFFDDKGNLTGSTALKEQFISFAESVFKTEETPVYVEKIASEHDENENGIPDSEDIIEGARLDVANQSRYTNAYYSGGYPPDDEGVCTDLVWRAFKNAGYELKDMIDIDIKSNAGKYPRITGAPDPNIDFRRVPNHIVFFTRHGAALTKEIDAGDMESLKQWQGGDIVSIERPQHIGIISDRRNKKGVPYVIHNMGPVPREEDCLESWNGRITGHFRYPM